MKIKNITFKFIYLAVVLARGEKVLTNLRSLRESQYIDKSKLEQIQLQRLNSLLKHASSNIKFYKHRIPESVQSINELSLIPFLTKEELRASQESMRYRVNIKQSAKTSGGSTGAPVTVYKDSYGMGLELAAAWRGYEWAGINIGDKQVRFWGLPNSFKARMRAKLIDLVCHRMRVSAFEYNAGDFKKIINNIYDFKPDYFYGYKSMIKEIADTMDVSGLNLKAVISTSEVLLEIERTEMQNNLSTRVYNEYGCGEVGTIAHECEAGNLHINAENLILEVVRSDGQKCDPGESGELVVTDLTNFSMPLIRYRLSDYGRVGTNDCPCGRSLPILKEVKGREYDTLINSDGNRFHGEFFLYILEDAKKKGLTLDGVQFIQNIDGSVEVNIKCDHSVFDSLCIFIKSRLENKFDRSLKYSFQKVKEIRREKSGKMRPVKRLKAVSDGEVND